MREHNNLVTNDGQVEHSFDTGDISGYLNLAISGDYVTLSVCAGESTSECAETIDVPRLDKEAIIDFAQSVVKTFTITPEEDIANKIELLKNKEPYSQEKVDMYTTVKMFEIMKALGYTDDENFENHGWDGDFDVTFSKEGCKTVRYSGCWYYGTAFISLD